MICVLPYAAKDQTLAQSLLHWITKLDPDLNQHTLVLLAASTIPETRQDSMVEIGKHSFGTVYPVRQRVVDERPWPTASNTMFRVATDFVSKRLKAPFLWLEPDCTPIKAGWLNCLDVEYQTCGKPFMGFIWDKPKPHMNGCAIYPAGYLFQGPDHIPFDVTVADQGNLPQTHHSDLFHHEWGNIEKNEPWTFPDAESLKRINPGAVLFHRNKNGDLIRRLTEQRNGHHVSPGAFQGLKKAVATFLGTSGTYYHSGNLGDIIWALYAIKLAGGGNLIIGPEQRRTSPCGMPVNEQQFNLFLPLLKQQPYLGKIEFSQTYPINRTFTDLNAFRNNWDQEEVKKSSGAHTLVKMHAHTLGVLDRFSDKETWIQCDKPISTARIIVSRTSRYHSGKTSPLFPWPKLIERFAQDMLFVGHPAEHERFCEEFKTNISFWKVTDFLELARVIKGGRAFLACQSFPHAIALAMGKIVVAEAWQPYADCYFDRAEYLDQNNNTLEEFEAVLA